MTEYSERNMINYLLLIGNPPIALNCASIQMITSNLRFQRLLHLIHITLETEQR